MWVFPKIGGKPPKWMVKIMENPINPWMIWGENPPFKETPMAIWAIEKLGTWELHVHQISTIWVKRSKWRCFIAMKWGICCISPVWGLSKDQRKQYIVNIVCIYMYIDITWRHFRRNPTSNHMHSTSTLAPGGFFCQFSPFKGPNNIAVSSAHGWSVRNHQRHVWWYWTWENPALKSGKKINPFRKTKHDKHSGEPGDST